MNRLKTFFKRHALLTGVLAVTFPLLFILYLQYRSLVTLETTLPVYRRSVMGDYLRSVAEESRIFYTRNAERVLNVPVDAITNRVGGIIQGKEKDVALKATTRAAEFFSRQEFKGAKRYFLVVDTEYEGVNRSAVLFYNPERKAMEFQDDAPELRAINVTCASYLVYIRAGAKIASWPSGSERDPMHPMIVKPLVDQTDIDPESKAMRLIAVAGMTVDEDFFTMEFFPDVIQKHLREYFPTDYQHVVISVNSSDEDALMIGSELVSSDAAEASIPLRFIFQRWSMRMRMRNMTGEQLARRNFFINVSLWTVMTLFLVGGIVMTLRTASRSMKLSEMKSDFVSNVSHELRTPLASIRVFGEFFKLGRVKEPEKMREYGEYIETESRRLTQLINNILDFSRIESGQKSYQFIPTHIQDVVIDTLKMFEVRMKQSDFVINFKVPTATLPQVLVDADAMTQAMVNLLDNAVKYSGTAREIEVRLAQKNNWVTVAVTDRGMGIPDEDHDRIFERFHRVSTGMVHDVRGSGLGLSIVKHIVEAHYGKVTVESMPGRGSTFTIHLPVEESTEAKPEAKRGKFAPGSDSLPQAGLKR